MNDRGCTWKKAESVVIHPIAAALVIMLLGIGSSPVSALDIILPTANTAIFDSPKHFYQHTARKGADAWKAGQYGFVRNVRTLKQGTVFTRFHEGVDIRPVYRDAHGEPLDSVWAIAIGTVVHANADAGASNYGKYVVVEHIWDGSPFYTLYAHLNEVWVETGELVFQGQELGRLGYTGAGINRARAHLHFEINVLINENFGVWFNELYAGQDNHHGIFNGMNLAGLDVARLYRELQENPERSISEFIASAKPFYTIRLPRTGRLDLLNRYPWLLKKSASPEHHSWEVSFDQSGFPLAVVPSKKKAPTPVAIWAEKTAIPYRYVTKYRLRGTSSDFRLSKSGERFIQLLVAEDMGEGAGQS